MFKTRDQQSSYHKIIELINLDVLQKQAVSLNKQYCYGKFTIGKGLKDHDYSRYDVMDYIFSYLHSYYDLKRLNGIDETMSWSIKESETVRLLTSTDNKFSFTWFRESLNCFPIDPFLEFELRTGAGVTW